MPADYRTLHEAGAYRVVEIPDTHFDVENLKGDTYNPAAHPDISPEQLADEERHFDELVSREGVYGYALEHWNPTTGAGWEHVDSCFGFVGQYSPNEETFNHYIVAELIGQIPAK